MDELEYTYQNKRHCVGSHKFTDLNRFKDVWGLIASWLRIQDFKTLRFVNSSIERHTRLSFFQRVLVRLTKYVLYTMSNDMAQVVSRVHDSQSGGQLTLKLYQMQTCFFLKHVEIYRTEQVEWDALTQITNLVSLDVSANNLSVLPSAIGKFISLEVLDVSVNPLKTLPDDIGKLVNLQTLNVYTSQLTRLPDSIGLLAHLQRLDMTHNQLSSLPDSIGQLVNLKLLDLSLNRLTLDEASRLRALFGLRIWH